MKNLLIEVWEDSVWSKKVLRGIVRVYWPKGEPQPATGINYQMTKFHPLVESKFKPWPILKAMREISEEFNKRSLVSGR